MADDGSEELARLLGISRAFKQAKALNLAGKLDLFTVCAEPGGLTLQQVCERLGFTYNARKAGAAPGDTQVEAMPHAACSAAAWPAPGMRGPADFLDLLVAMKVLTRQGSGPSARYATHPAAARFLVRGSPECITGILALNNDRSSVLFNWLEDALREGQVPQRAREQVPDITTTFSAHGAHAGGAEHFALGMLGASIGNFTRLAQVVDFATWQHVVDIGGSTGCCCVALCAAHPHLSATTCDLPAVHEVAQRYVEQHGMAGRVKVLDLDFFSDQPFPQADVIVMGMVLHDWGIEKKKLLISKAKAALRPGGAFIAVEQLIDDNRTEAAAALAQSLNMLVEFGKECAFDYSFKEFCDWTRAAGFSRMECHPLVGTSSAALAYL